MKIKWFEMKRPSQQIDVLCARVHHIIMIAGAGAGGGLPLWSFQIISIIFPFASFYSIIVIFLFIKWAARPTAGVWRPQWRRRSRTAWAGTPEFHDPSLWIGSFSFETGYPSLELVSTSSTLPSDRSRCWLLVLAEWTFQFLPAYLFTRVLLRVDLASWSFFRAVRSELNGGKCKREGSNSLPIN